MPSDDEVTPRAGSVRAMTGLPQQDFAALRPHVEHALLASREDHTMDGQPRPNRRYRTYANTPLPTVADQWLCMLTYVKQHPIQDVHGPLFGMSQSHAHQWIHRRHPVLKQA